MGPKTKVRVGDYVKFKGIYFNTLVDPLSDLSDPSVPVLVGVIVAVANNRGVINLTIDSSMCGYSDMFYRLADDVSKITEKEAFLFLLEQ